MHIDFPDGVEADVLLAKWKCEAAVIERAERIDIGVIAVPVPRTSDLILLKLAAGGPTRTWFVSSKPIAMHSSAK